jgi:hypothetical protein
MEKSDLPQIYVDFDIPFGHNQKRQSNVMFDKNIGITSARKTIVSSKTATQ